ncbi:MAG TPA: hypothetical protein VK771_08030 [Acidimicrobiia bacterium]|nr:hypothetical protein [Acidimicrobiia bacterium]
MAKRAVYISSLLIVAERMRDLAARDAERDEWSKFLQLGEYSRDTYLGVAHEDTTLSDSPAAFAEFRRAADGWEAHALSVSRRLWVEDEKWRAAWEGPSYRVATVSSGVVAESGASPLAVADRADDRDDRRADAPLVAGAATTAQVTFADPSAQAGARIADAVTDEPQPIPTAGGTDVPLRSVSGLDRSRPESRHDRRREATAVPEVATDQTSAAVACIFCNGPVGPVEYVWPEWVCRTFAAGVAAGNIDGAANDGLVARMRNEVDQTIDCVCQACVHGWMRDLDDEVHAFLHQMVKGTETRLSPRQQGLLAKWATKTAAVMEYADDSQRIPRSACEFVRRIGVHDGTQVLLGRYRGNVRLLSHQRDLFRRTIDGTDYAVPQATFVIGDVFLQVLTDPWRNNPPTPVEDATPLLIPLVPVHNRKIDWPPPTSIDDSLYDVVRLGTT